MQKIYVCTITLYGKVKKKENIHREAMLYITTIIGTLRTSPQMNFSLRQPKARKIVIMDIYRQLVIKYG